MSQCPSLVFGQRWVLSSQEDYEPKDLVTLWGANARLFLLLSPDTEVTLKIPSFLSHPQDQTHGLFVTWLNVKSSLWNGGQNKHSWIMLVVWSSPGRWTGRSCTLLWMWTLHDRDKAVSQRQKDETKCFLNSLVSCITPDKSTYIPNSVWVRKSIWSIKSQPTGPLL